MKQNFQIEVDKDFWNPHLWNQLYRAYEKNQLDSYIENSFKNHQFLFRRVCSLFTLFKSFTRSNSQNFAFDPKLIDSFRFWFDIPTKTVMFGSRGPDEKKIKAQEYGVPDKQKSTQAFSRLTQAFYIYLKDQHLI